MAIEYTKDFWNKQNSTINHLSPFNERLISAQNYSLVNSTIYNGAISPIGYADLLNGKKAFNDSVISERDKTQSDLDFIKNTGLSSSDVSDTDEVSKIKKEIDLQSQVQYLQMYYDSYMLTQNGDAQWRLGDVTGTYKTVNKDDNVFNTIINGSVKTRSNMSFCYKADYVSPTYGRQPADDTKYTSLGFPPYKWGLRKINEKTNFMSKVIGDYTFDKDNFKVSREDVTARDVGMKSLSDWINYLQFIAEGATGIVSTYLTEWDLSLYIQEGLMQPKVNGGPMNVYLNYRIHEDNPLAQSGYYTDDRSLVFNVCGSSVSKLFYDCMKNWRPSDFPLSNWWMPYLRGRDWDLAGISAYGVSVPYLSIYDEWDINFDYTAQKDLKSIIRHQDFYGYIARAANTFDNPYWSAFYSSESDGMTNIDIKLKNLINKVAGADYGVSSQSGKDTGYLLNLAKKETILNGGYYGGPSTVDQNGGLYGRTMVENSLNENDDAINSKESGFQDQEASYNTDVDIGNVSSLVKTNMSDDKKDSSQMSKTVGVNRFSPAIYGGPHSSEYSPKHLRDFFTNELVSREIPKIGYTPLVSGELDATDKENEKGNYYFSPSTALKYLKEGAYTARKKLVYYKDWIELDFEATPTFNQKTLAFDMVFPTNYNGERIIYTGNIRYKTKVYNVKNLLEAGKLPKWWTFALKSVATVDGNLAYIKTPVRRGKYLGFLEKTVKVYEVNDRPDVKWKIVTHKFKSYTTPNGKKEALFNGITTYRKGAINDEDFKELSKKAGYILTFDNPAIEEEIKLQILQYNKGVTNSPKYLYFCGCDNLSDRYTKGPSYIFKAPVYVRYYENIIEYYSKILFWKVKVGESTTYMPYLYVDLENTTEYFDIDAKEHETNVINHLQPIAYNTEMTYSPIQKMKLGMSHRITAYKDTKTGGGFGAIISLITGKGGGVNNGTGTPMWTSNASFGIEGIGILSGWQGVDPSTEPAMITPSLKYDMKKYIMRQTSSFENIPLKSLPMKAVKQYNMISFRQDKNPHITFMTDEGFDLYQTYTAMSLDAALKNALNKICTTVYFKRYDSNDTAKMSIKEPLKNFVSYCVSELNSMNMAKDVFQTLNWENLRKVMLYNVDACVLKACGIQKTDDNTFVKVKADKKHVLYNYWIDVAAQLFFDKKDFDKKRNEILQKFTAIISSLKISIDKIMETIKKDDDMITYNDLRQAMAQLYIQQENTKKNCIDDFMFAYLNILYVYRLYFIGKRFNKEDGTMWTMRQLESTIDLVHTDECPPKSPKDLNDDYKDIYNVVFYELQNTLDAKRDVIINEDHKPLAVDKIYRIYVKVEYGTENDWNRWIAYRDNPNDNPKVREIIRVNVDGDLRYIFKPTDGLYQFKSKEWNDNLKNEEWNSNHKDKQAKEVKDYINCIFPIEWKPMKEKTPIRWNVFGSVNVDNLLEYSRESISAQDLVCLTEEGADFWTITIPANLWPEKSLYKTKLYIKLINENTDVYNDVSTVVLGPFANSTMPIAPYDSQMLAGLKEEVSFLK